MHQTMATSDPASGAQSRENDILSDMERLLDEPPAEPPVAPTTSPRIRWFAPFVLLVGVGVALALMPVGVKDALTTGRSVAHSPDR